MVSELSSRPMLWLEAAESSGLNTGLHPDNAVEISDTKIIVSL